MNLIPKLAEMLGVEIGEEFKVKTDRFTSETLFRITESGAECSVNGEDYCDADHMFCAILEGKYEIVKLPFKPKEGKMYWSVRWGREQQLFISSGIWANDDIDYRMLYCGNCFRTEAEAEAHKCEIYERLTGKKWGGEQ